MLDGGFIQNSKLLIQNFAARAECAFPRDHFLTESERSGERLLEAARRVGGSESITGFLGWYIRLRALRLRRDKGSQILDDGLWVGLILKDHKYVL